MFRIEYPHNRTIVVLNENGEHIQKGDNISIERERIYYSWIRNPDAQRIVRDGVRFKSIPSVIMMELIKAKIKPLPSTKQLYNYITPIRKKEGRKLDLKQQIIFEMKY